jgi:hypothetical protein
MKTKFAAVVLALALAPLTLTATADAAPSGHAAPADCMNAKKFKKVHKGDTMAQVKNKVGAPDGVSQTKPVVVWSYLSCDFQTLYTVTFKHKVVIKKQVHQS